MLSGQLGEDGLEAGLFGPLEGHGEAEAGRQAHQLLPGVGLVDVITGAVGHGLLDEVAAVGGRIDRNVSGPAAHAAFEDGLEGCEVVVVGGKAQVVDEEDELERVRRQLVHQVGDLIELVLLDFHQAQAVGCELVGDGLDRARFAGARVTVQQDVVGRHPGQQGLGVSDDLFPLALVTGQFGQALGVRVLDRHQTPVLHREDMVFGKHAVALFPGLLHPLRISRCQVDVLRLPPGQEGQFRPLGLFGISRLEQLIQRQAAKLLQKAQFAVQRLLQHRRDAARRSLPHTDRLGLQHRIGEILAQIGGLLEQSRLKGRHGVTHRAHAAGARLHPVGQVQ